MVPGSAAWCPEPGAAASGRALHSGRRLKSRHAYVPSRSGTDGKADSSLSDRDTQNWKNPSTAIGMSAIQASSRPETPSLKASSQWKPPVVLLWGCWKPVSSGEFMSIRKYNQVRILQSEVLEEKNEVGRLMGHQQEQVPISFLLCSLFW